MIPVLLIHPETAKRESKVEKILVEQGMTRNHPDLLWFEAEAKMGVEQARQIKDFLSLKPYQGIKQAIAIISAENLTLDAQNTLLKTLEEPPGEVVIVLGVSSEDQLLPTILSRCQIVDLASSEQSQNEVIHKYDEDIEKLLNLNSEGRFQFIEKLKERDEFLPALTKYFRKRLLENNAKTLTLEQIHNFLKELLTAEKWAKSNVNIRAILEYLMLKMPQQ